MMGWLRQTEYARTVVLVLGGLLVLWQAAVWLLQVRPFILPAPTEIFAELIRSWAFFVSQTAYTSYVTLVGFGIAVVAGILIAIAIVSSRFLDRTLYTLLVALNSVPKVALAPLFVIWLGTGGAPKISIAALIAVFPIVINATLGLRAVDPDMLDLARAGQASRPHVMTKIRLPNALPSIFAGAKVGISFALIGAIVGEFVAGERGLGYAILESQSTFNTPRVFAAILILGLLGTLLFFAVDLCERLLVPWHVSQRNQLPQ